MKVYRIDVSLWCWLLDQLIKVWCLCLAMFSLLQDHNGANTYADTHAYAPANWHAYASANGHADLQPHPGTHPFLPKPLCSITFHKSDPQNTVQYPTSTPTPSPSAAPTSSPTPYPTGSPTLYPTALPTSTPTPSPTGKPTPLPVHYRWSSAHRFCKIIGWGERSQLGTLPGDVPGYSRLAPVYDIIFEPLTLLLVRACA